MSMTSPSVGFDHCHLADDDRIGSPKITAICNRNGYTIFPEFGDRNSRCVVFKSSHVHIFSQDSDRIRLRLERPITQGDRSAVFPVFSHSNMLDIAFNTRYIYIVSNDNDISTGASIKSRT